MVKSLANPSLTLPLLTIQLGHVARKGTIFPTFSVIDVITGIGQKNSTKDVYLWIFCSGRELWPHRAFEIFCLLVV